MKILLQRPKCIMISKLKAKWHSISSKLLHVYLSGVRNLTHFDDTSIFETACLNNVMLKGPKTIWGLT